MIKSNEEYGQLLYENRNNYKIEKQDRIILSVLLIVGGSLMLFFFLPTTKTLIGFIPDGSSSKLLIIIIALIFISLGIMIKFQKHQPFQIYQNGIILENNFIPFSHITMIFRKEPEIIKIILITGKKQNLSAWHQNLSLQIFNNVYNILIETHKIAMRNINRVK